MCTIAYSYYCIKLEAIQADEEAKKVEVEAAKPATIVGKEETDQT